MVGQDLNADGAAKAMGAASKRHDEPLLGLMASGTSADLGRMASGTSASGLLGRMASRRSASGLGGRVAVHD
jgi:hypothetical protein